MDRLGEIGVPALVVTDRHDFLFPLIPNLLVALSVAQMERQHITRVATFDQDFDRFKAITRRSEERASPAA